MAILSNSAGSKDDKDHLEAKTLETQLGIRVIRHTHKKPHVREDILDFFSSEPNPE
jgi:phosphatidylglycerophosphatase GEP4